MSKSFVRRALVALGLSLGLVAQSASPAAASTLLYTSGGPVAGWAADGTGSLAESNGYVYNYATVYHDADHLTCAEVWVDVKLTNNDHHAPDVFINCDKGFNPSASQWTHWSGANGPTGTTIQTGSVRPDPNEGAVVVCGVDTRTWARSKTVNCTTGDIDVAQYSGKTPDELRAMNDWDEPEYIAPDGDGLDIRRSVYNHVLLSGSSMVSRNGLYRAAMQFDGNFVIYYMPGDGSQTAIWAMGTNGSGADRVIIQSDGNMVLRRSDGSCVKHTNTWSYGIDVFQMRPDGLLQGLDENTGTWYGIAPYSC